MTPENQARIRQAMRLAAQAAKLKALSNEIRDSLVSLEAQKHIMLRELLGELISKTESECDRLFWLVVGADE